MILLGSNHIIMEICAYTDVQCKVIYITKSWKKTNIYQWEIEQIKFTTLHAYDDMQHNH